MPTFRYSAVAPDGSTSRGIIETTDRTSAVTALRERGLTLLDVTERSGRLSDLLPSGLMPKRGALGLRDLSFIARQLDNLLSAGSDLDRSLTVAAGLQSNSRIREAISEIGRQIRQGKSLADALASRGHLFPAFFVSMVRAGESAGALAATFKRLADVLERQHHAKTKLITSLIYPAILLVATLASIVLVMTVVVPRFEPIFHQAGAELPMLTRVIVGLSRFLSDAAAYVLPLGLVGAFVVTKWLDRPSARAACHAALLRLRLIGPLVLKSETARLCYVLGSLLQGGVPLLTALTIAQDSVWNLRLRAAVASVRENVKDGVKLSGALQRQATFPDLMVQLTAVAEESAKLGDTLLEVGRIYDNETDTAIQRLIAVATPAATIGLGGMVGLVLAAILLAVLQVNDLAL